MPPKPKNLIKLVGRRQNVNTTGFQDAHIIGQAFYNRRELEWLAPLLRSGLGDDRLEGGDDADLYVVNAGEGQDVISDEVRPYVLIANDNMAVMIAA